MYQMPEKEGLRRWPSMTSWTDSIKQSIYFVEPDDMISIGRSIPLNPQNGRAPYCIYQRPSKDGTVHGVRCGVDRWLCRNCELACIPYQGRL
jgi:hypothetical protein